MKFESPTQESVFEISQGVENAANGERLHSVQIDEQVANLIDWLAKEQGIAIELALKKAVVNAAYIHHILKHQGSKLLVQNKDNSISEIVLK